MDLTCVLIKYRTMHSCPRYHTCSIPICLLDSNRAKRRSFGNERKCTMSKKQLGQIQKDSRLKVSDEGKTYRDKLYEEVILGEPVGIEDG